MTRDQYFAYVNGFRRKRRRFLKWFPFAALLLATGLFSLVHYGSRFGIGPAVRDYMLSAGPLTFSGSELRHLTETTTGHTVAAPLLSIVYWVYFAAFALAGLVLVSTPIVLRMGLIKRPPWASGFLETSRIVVALQQFSRSGRRIDKIRLWRAMFRSDLNYLVSPVRKNWFKHPEHQWMQPADLNRQTRSIVLTLGRFDSSLRRAVRLEACLREFLNAVETLSDFFFVVAQRSDPEFIKVKAGSSAEDAAILGRFVRVARPAIIEIARVHRERAGAARFFDFISDITRAPIVRGAVTISSVAAGVMILGWILFQIPKDQAFLTWFTVTFGSLTISVGVESVRRTREATRGDPSA